MKKAAKRPSKSVRKPTHRKGAHSVYSNLSTKRRTKSDAKSRKKAEFLATLPKSRLKRIAYRLSPKRFFKYWFSKQGALMALKISGLGLALMIVLLLSVFAIFRKDLALGPDELTKRVQSRTTKFYDRTGKTLLYELYKDQQLTFVQPDDISNNMKWATVAIEDRDFYKHSGFDIRGIIRSVFVNVSGTGRQGASTITQQLARNVILEDNTRTGVAGYTRKIKEVILSIELERMYSKDEILNFYLNSSGYGGTAYGVESAAQRYFGKSAKNLDIAESAYIAAIPQFPSLYDRNSATFDPEATLSRQQTVIDYMRDQGYISQAEAKEAKDIEILAAIKPLSDEPTNKRAPHFVDEIIKQLEEEYGASNVRSGGWRITTTLDWKMQKLAEKTVRENMYAVEQYNGDNAALVAIDVETNQVLSMVGSRNYRQPGWGSYNAATAELQPGSSLKPFVYASLFAGNQYGAGSVIPDTKQCWYSICPNNFDNRFRGNISIRQSLAESRNLPAMKAAELAGMEAVIKHTKAAGEKDITCGTENECSNPFLAIGQGNVRLDQHTAAYATLARKGVALPQSYILKIEKSNGEVVQEWKKSRGTPVYGNKSTEISYMISDILADDRARRVTFMNTASFNPPGVKIAVKTGTTDNAKDGWMMGYSPNLAVGIWVGRADGVAMGDNAVTYLQTGPMFGSFVEQAHKQIMTRPQYGWKENDWFQQPPGLQMLRVAGYYDMFPSWYQKPQEGSKKFTMDRVSKKLATDCTPDAAQEEISVPTMRSGNGPETLGQPPAGYDIHNEDDAHKCGDPLPRITLSQAGNTGLRHTFSATASRGRSPIDSVEFVVNGQVISRQSGSKGSYSTSHTFSRPGRYTVQVRVTDKLYYQNTSSITILVGGSDD